MYHLFGINVIPKNFLISDMMNTITTVRNAQEIEHCR